MDHTSKHGESKVLKDCTLVTVSCAEGDEGRIYDGLRFPGQHRLSDGDNGDTG